MKEYNPRKIEEKWSRFWIERSLYHVEKPKEGRKFSVVIPPPNVTGSLHMGHALNATLQDIIVRWERMKGRNAVWVPGFDHAGIATQYVVEKQLREKGISGRKLGRYEFLKKVWEWVPVSREAIRTQLEKLGVSVDWKRERFTLDEGFSRAVRKAFRELFDRGLIYRGEYIVNWCPRDLTALSDLEVEHEEEEGKLWFIRYPLEDGSGYITVATTRPETMLGDTAVAIHPEDERYRHLVGKRVKLPLVSWSRKDLKGREVSEFIPIVADERVKMEFGTGAVKVTPAHDPNDFEMGRDHGLPFVKVMDEQAVMNENAGDFRGLDRYEARKRIVERLREEGFLEREEEHLHAVGRCYRCKTVVEPMVSVQWFVKVSNPAIRDVSVKVVREGLKRREERVREIRYIEAEALSVRVSVVSEISGELKAVVLAEEGVLFISGVEGGEISFLYYPSHREEVRKEAERLTETLLRRYPDLNFVIGLEGSFSLMRGGQKKTVGKGRYLILSEGSRLILHSYDDGTEFVEILEEGKALLEPSQRSMSVRVEREKVVREERRRIRFVPSHWEKFYSDWMENLRDWCISRQIWWGHRIPVWHCKECGELNVYTDDDFEGFHSKLIFNLIADGRLGEDFTPEEVIKILSSPNFVHPDMTVLEFYKRFVFHRYHSADLSAESLLLALTREAAGEEKPLYRFDPGRERWRMILRCRRCGSENLSQEEDVLDTWFSSALWPFGVFGWPEETEDLRKLYPTDLLVTGFDIIFFWVARMIMMGTYLMGDIPFRDVYVHALVRDEKGQKMSKTKGNVIDPLDIIERYGADALRFTLAALTVQGRDIKLSEKRFEGYRHFANKIWNAGRFILMNTPPDLLSRLPHMADLRPEDRWIMTRLNETAGRVNASLEEYDFSTASRLLYDFFWSDFCDWYIEFTKARIYRKPPEEEEERLRVEAERTTALYTLNYVFEKALRLLHPFMPFITEELWHMLPNAEGESVSLKEYPQKREEEIFPEETRRVERLREIVSTIRALRSDLQIEPSKRLRAFFRAEGSFSRSVIEEFRDHILSLARLESFEEVEERPPGTAATFSGDVEVFLLVEGHIDIERLLASYERKREKLLSELARVKRKLSSEEFIRRAPPEVVEREKRIREEIESDLAKVERLLRTLRT